MSYQQQPGNWGDPSWPGQTPSYDPQSPYGDPPPAQPGDPAAALPGYPAPGQPGYPAPGYPGSGYPAYGYPPPQPTNGLAIASLVCSLAGLGTCITAPVGAILGHVARRQIRERGEGGDGMALAGIIVGWILTALLLLLVAFYIVVIVMAVNTEGTYSSAGDVFRTAAAFTALAG
jgi:hypothetical protein